MAADRRILVVTPEATAIENAYHFLKAAFFRALRDAAREESIGAALAPVLDEARRSGATPRELVEAASRADARAGARLRARLREFEVDLVVNRADPDESDPGAAIATAARAQLGMNLRLAGSLAEDASVPAAVERGVPVMQLFPAARFCTDVHALVASLFASEPASATRAFALARGPRARRGRARALAGAAAAAPRLRCSGGTCASAASSSASSLRALHERTRIRHHYLEAIEAERFAALPPDVFLREYVRQVAHALGISDPAEYARRFVAKAHASRCGVALASAGRRERSAGAESERAAAVRGRFRAPSELLAEPVRLRRARARRDHARSRASWMPARRRADSLASVRCREISSYLAPR